MVPEFYLCCWNDDVTTIAGSRLSSVVAQDGSNRGSCGCVVSGWRMAKRCFKGGWGGFEVGFSRLRNQNSLILSNFSPILISSLGCYTCLSGRLQDSMGRTALGDRVG